jgi:hypothetical protein
MLKTAPQPTNKVRKCNISDVAVMYKAVVLKQKPYFSI